MSDTPAKAPPSSDTPAVRRARRAGMTVVVVVIAWTVVAVTVGVLRGVSAQADAFEAAEHAEHAEQPAGSGREAPSATP